VSFLLFGLALVAHARRRDLAEARQLATDLHSRELSLRLAALAFEGSSEGIMITDAAGRIVAANDAFVRSTGYGRSELLGQNPRLLQSKWHSAAFYREMWDTLLREGRWQGEILDRRRDGELYAQLLSISCHRDENGEITHHVAISSDITERRRAQERIDHLAFHDPLTNLPNRALLASRLETAIAEARERKSHLALLFVDVDRFKAINDSLGHLAGDKVLIEVASRLCSGVRSGDTVARVGGDEYVVVIEHVAVNADASQVAEKLLALVARPMPIEGQELRLTASAGISLFPDDGEQAEFLLSRADTAMYHAKSSGRNNYRFFTGDLAVWTSDRLELENDLRVAVERQELELLYQARYACADGRLTGFEALLRWRHPRRGLLEPNAFIPLAEESGAIVQIGAWVLTQACNASRRWREHGAPEVCISVNLSAVQLAQPDLPHTVAAALAAAALPPEQLELEITESMLMPRIGNDSGVLREIDALGVRLALDDFGTGYSSLARLRRFPIHRLKIDRSFVSGLPGDRDSSEIVSAILALGRGLHLEVVAEGVENEEQLAFLRQEGCGEFQGHLRGLPLAIEGVLSLLAARRPSSRLD